VNNVIYFKGIEADVHSANGFSPYKSLIYKRFLLSGFWVSPLHSPHQKKFLINAFTRFRGMDVFI